MLGEWFFCICNVILGMCAKIFWVLYQVDVNTEVGVVRDIRLKELRLYTDYGRCSRPLFIVEKQRLLIKKEDVRALQMKVRGNENHVEIMSTWAARCSVCPYCFFQIVNWQWYACRRLLRMVGTIWCQRDSSSMSILKKRRQPWFPWQLQYVLLNYSLCYNL